MSNVLNLLFGPLSEYVKTVHSKQPDGVGELSKAHPLIQLYVYDDNEDPFVSREQQARGTKRRISTKFIQALMACSLALRKIDISVTDGSNARRVANMINMILTTGRFEPTKSSSLLQQQLQGEQQESSRTALADDLSSRSWVVSEETFKKIEELKKNLMDRRNPDRTSLSFIEETISTLTTPSNAINEEDAKTEFTSRVSEKFATMFKLEGQRGPKTNDVLRELRNASQTEKDIFNLFFTVHDTLAGDKVVQLSEIDYNNLHKYRINVKSFTSEPGTWTNEKIPKSLSGGAEEKEPNRVPAIFFYVPLLGEGDLLSMENIKGHKYALRLLGAQVFYGDKSILPSVSSGDFTMDVLTISAVAQMKYIACSDKPNNVFRTAQSTVNPPELNLTRDFWVRRTDGTYERKQLDGSYKVLTPEECDELLNSNCAASLVSNGDCSNFMKAVVSGDVSKLKLYLSASDFSWDRAEKDLNQMNPNVVLEILKAFGFGPYTNSFGTEKQMCSVEDWLKQPLTLKNFGNENGKRVEINGKLRSYLELLVAFVNKNKSILNPHLQKQAVGTVPDEVTNFGVYDGTKPYDNTYPKSGCEGPINWSQLRNTTASFAAPQFGSITTYDPVNPMPFLTNLPGQRFPGQALIGFGQQGGQRGGALFSQQGGTEVSASSDIKMQLDSVIQMLKQSNKSLSPEDEASLHKKVASFTQLEQELWEQLCKLNRYRECLSMCGDTTPSTVVLRDLDELVQKYKHTGAKYNTNNDCLQNLCYMLTQLLTQNTSNSSFRAITPLQ
jgi:hypothetical protein